MTPGEQYQAKLEAMVTTLRDWKAAGKTAVIQFNFPKELHLGMGVGEALKYHFITADPSGIELLKAWGMDTADEPTPLMCLAVIEGYDS